MEDILKVIDYLKGEFSSYKFIIDTSNNKYIMVTIRNPNGDRNIYIKFNYHDEINLLFGEYQSTYNYNSDDFEYLIDTINGIVNSELVSISISGLKQKNTQNNEQQLRKCLLLVSLDNPLTFNQDSFILEVLKDFYKVRAVIIGWNILDCKVVEY